MSCARSIRSLFILTLVVLSIAACSPSKNRVGGMLNLDTDLKLTFEVDSDINPDENNRPSPVFVRFYQLKSPTAFNKADFIDLYERDEELLGADIVSRQTLKPIAPGEVRTERFVLEKGVNQIALYAEFFQYRGSNYKVIVPVTENNIIRNAVTVKISGTSISIAKK
ncbi:MAG: type VI secretion system lipoprotein TssJ [Cellvibrio sp.]|jgi:type VI secretion system protein VasD